MKQKSQKAKLKEGRGLGEGKDYVGFYKANEAKSSGTASQIADPVAGRTVDVLSRGENIVFWLLRFNPAVKEIKEQYPMARDVVSEICRDAGFHIPSNILTTDFYVTYMDGSRVAISVKPTRSFLQPEKTVFERERKQRTRCLKRQWLEKKYWERFGVKFVILFTDELNHKLANNIRAVLAFYDHRKVSTVDQMYKWLIAHRFIVVDMETDYIDFARIAKENAREIADLYHSEVDKYGIVNKPEAIQGE